MNATETRKSNKNLIAALARMVEAATDRDQAEGTLDSLKALEAGAADRKDKQQIRQAGIVLARKWGL